MTTLAFGNRLSALAWAQKLKELVAVKATEEGFATIADIDSLEIDLSNARSADFLVLGRLLVLIDRLTSNGAQIILRMPSKGLLESEQAYLANNQPLDTPAQTAAVRQIRQHQRQRVACRLFIKQSGFDSALETGPLEEANIQITEGLPITSHEPVTSVSAVRQEPLMVPGTPQRRRGIVPYRWLNLSKPANNQNEVDDPLSMSIRRLGLNTRRCHCSDQRYIA